jgi:hypothetical protein
MAIWWERILLGEKRLCVKVMADYDCSPLWLESPSGSGNVSVDELPISGKLAAEFLEWAYGYDRTLNRCDPALSGFSTMKGARNFAIRGEELAKRLALELGSSYVVSYFDNEDGQVRRIS